MWVTAYPPARSPLVSCASYFSIQRQPTIYSALPSKSWCILPPNSAASGMVAVAGVLLPGLHEIAASVASVDHQAAGHVEADLLELVRDAIGQEAPGTVQLALDVLQFTPPSCPSLPKAMERGA
jgi:hypothetical protein